MQNTADTLAELRRTAAHLNAGDSIEESELYRTMLQEFGSSILVIAKSISLVKHFGKSPKKKKRSR